MKQINLFNQIESSGRNSRSLAMPHVLHRVVAILVIVMMCDIQMSNAMLPPGPNTYYAQVTVSVNDNNMGTATVNSSNSQKKSTTTSGGSLSFSIVASPKEGYEFVEWKFTSTTTGTFENKDKYSTTVSVKAATKKDNTASYTVQAVFRAKPKTYYYSIVASLSSESPANSGTVTPSSAYTGSVQTTAASGTAKYTVTAEAKTGYEFVGWSTANNESSYISGAGSSYEYTINNITGTSNASPNPQVTLYAHFRELPLVYFKATAVAVPTDGGTVSASVTDESKRASSSTNPSATTSATYTVTNTAAGYYFIGWSDTEGGEIKSTATSYTKTITATSTSSSSPTETKAYANFKPEPTGITVSPTSMVIGVGGTQKITTTLSPTNAYENITYTSNATGVATVAADGTVTGVAAGTATITVTAKKSDGTAPTDLTKTVSVAVMEQVATPVISFTPIDDGTKATATITCATDGATIYYTINSDDPTPPSAAKKRNIKTLTSPQGTNLYSDPFTVETNDVVKAIAVKSGNYINSAVATLKYSPKKVPAPTISIINGKVTFSCEEPGVTFYYTTDGTTTPTTSSNSWQEGNAPFAGVNEKDIKVIAVKAGFVNSNVSSKLYIVGSGISTDGGTVILNDYEDHNWSYYKGLDYTFDDETKYKDKYKYSIYSPDPRNVKITYRGYDIENGKIDLGGATKVNISTLNDNTAPHVSNATGEGQNTFVYYKTLEKFVIGFFDQNKADNGDWDGTPADPNNTAEQYPYTVISNPFSVRPSTTANGTKTYYGFAGWKIISGKDKIRETFPNDIIPLDAIIHFTDLGTVEDGKYTPNCTSAEIVLEATWTPATVKTDGLTYSDAARAYIAPTFSGGTYETNFWVMPAVANNFNVNSPCTIIGMNPDGTSDNSATRTISNNLTVNTSGTTPATNTVKVEWIRHGDVTFNANGKNMTLGRGITSSSRQGTIYCCNANKACVNIVKVESGNYNKFTPINTAIDAGYDVNTYIIYGCDYDKALADYYSSETNAYNTKLQVNGMAWSGMAQVHRPNGKLYLRTLFKSGIFPGEYYTHRSSHTGQRFVTIEGGYFQSDITGGSETNETQPNARAFTLRGKGNFRVDGRIAGGSTSNNCSGDRCIVLTGGRVGGWIAAGSNSGSESGGVTTGETFVYIGGNAEVNSRQFDADGKAIFNTSTGGVVYGAGCGINHNSTAGGVTKGSNIVLSDDAYVERGIYGGGAMGRISAGQSSNIFVLGGHVGTGIGTITDSANPAGQREVTVSMTGVFGGACNVGGGYSNIYMNGGVVEGGIFGGSNITGTMDNDVRIQIDGGQVGTSTKTANVHGGGYGQPTRVTGNVDITLGILNQKGTTLYGNVYGGSALGQVNNSTSNHTWVTMNSGTIHGSIFGGGMGRLTSTGRNASFATGEGVVNGAIKVVVNGTDPTTYDASNKKVYAVDAVFGGCDMVTYNGTPIVEIHNCESSIDYVYGGGNASNVQHTDVTIWGGDINYVFGGGNGEDASKPGANIVGNAASSNKGNTNVKIYGGTINYIFGGSNTLGNVTGTATVFLNEQAESGKEQCPILVQEAYGGANKAPMDGTPMLSIGCLSGRLENVYGGSKAVDVNSNVVLSITSGQFGKVFGGNNVSGDVKGSITVNIDETGCHPIIIDELYAGGNMAAYTTPEGKNEPTVNVISCTHIGKVFGGGYGTTAIVTGNPIVNINQIAGVYDPEDTDGTDGWANNPGTKLGTIGDIFGGGNAAKVVGNTHVNIGTIEKNAHMTTPTTMVKVGANITGNVYGGGNQADVTGKTNVTVGKKN